MKILYFRRVKFLLSLLFLSTILFTLDSCTEVSEPELASVEFSMGSPSAGSASEANLTQEESPNSVLVTILDDNGDTLYNRESIDLLRFGDSLISEKIELLEGEYTLTEFFVLDESGDVIYAAPKKDSPFARLVDITVDLEFTAVLNKVTPISVEVIKTKYAKADDFGYGSFNLNIVETIDFQIAVSVYNESTDQLELTTASLSITDKEESQLEVELGDSTNVVKLKANLEDYFMTIKKEEYNSFIDTLSFDQISDYVVGKSVFKITLAKEGGDSNSPVYLGENGVTIKVRDGAEIGDTGEVNGVTYTVVDEAILRQMVEDGEDVSKVATTRVQNMSKLFLLKNNISDISNWDVSNVTDMFAMFSTASSFNQDISGWDVSKVTDMSEMFDKTSFNQPIGNWNVSNVTNMRFMFYKTPFNQDISNWNVGNVTNMEWMFVDTNFDQDIGDWDVSNVTSMGIMFQSTPFNQDIGGWDVSNVTNMFAMFAGTSFNQDISGWDVSKVSNMEQMFSGASSFNQDISGWDVSSVTNMRFMFNQTPFNQDIGGWNVGNVTNMENMFSVTGFNQNLENWDVEDVTKCSRFAEGNSVWTEPKPNFTNCDSN